MIIIRDWNVAFPAVLASRGPLQQFHYHENGRG
jgi:hypothetical protein